MIVIYTQDKTLIRKNADQAKNELIELYGEKFGTAAFDAVNGAPVATRFRENGGPLVVVVSKDEAEKIKDKERAIGMLAE